ncbi:hypothetical protein LTR91_019696 [Friedmanniomyces endolithicus]|uniref:N-acetyltransferase domain-containing protein n=1 Tax=Friedmanniomyces endolithicus TaxID=329885 RepID=A0AAN6HAQ8_9PEZI|nr:hypothetical protein LTR94_015810 [Friedmanniomyces endolithicus]KAK0783040.1 hypothetical protein LTR38_013148 [Friedmanniomyces endolithicus]KAK0787800.1 hypothetical protein LTR75_012798 [Friedmanniomyces endolithicus]KAK0788830.1 hypothetical protein LTR59_009846 [Friedmanniomyces endolithicus]KAK0844842.1 hypothetical protein LTR03_007837 [Friedmanniomyces endolithicus]
MSDPFRSERLIYRAVITPDDDAFFLTVQQDPLAFRNASGQILKPQNKQSTVAFVKLVAEEALLGVIIALPAAEPETTSVPIGILHLDAPSAGHSHHRRSSLGIDIIRERQGQGIGVSCFQQNESAIRLYRRLGFQQEGVTRDYLWSDGRWWDEIQFGMLESEWKEMEGKRA